MTSTFKDGCRLLSCLLVFSGPASAWARLSVIGWPAGAVTGMTASLSQGTPGDTHTHTPSLRFILPHSLHTGMGTTGAATSVKCVETKDSS